MPVTFTWLLLVFELHICPSALVLLPQRAVAGNGNIKTVHSLYKHLKLRLSDGLMCDAFLGNSYAI